MSQGKSTRETQHNVGVKDGPQEHLTCPLGERKTESLGMTIRISENRAEKCHLAEVKTYSIWCQSPFLGYVPISVA